MPGMEGLGPVFLGGGRFLRDAGYRPSFRGGKTPGPINEKVSPGDDGNVSPGARRGGAAREILLQRCGPHVIVTDVTNGVRAMSVQSLRRLPGGVYAYDMADLAWQDVGKPGLHQKVVRADRERGLYLGMIGFDPMTRTGLHQHQGTAISYFLDGSLYDYDGQVIRGQAGINLKGATHDAISYTRCIFAARLEGPVTYRPEDGVEGRVHTGSHAAEIRNPAPEVPPEMNITVDALPSLATTLAGVTRRMIFDYRRTEDVRRFVQLALLPGTTIPAHATSALAEFFVLGGDLRVNGTQALGGSFVVIEPDTEVEIRTEYGARLLAWAEGAVRWADDPARPDLYGF
jgi:hypothetical protein